MLFLKKWFGVCLSLPDGLTQDGLFLEAVNETDLIRACFLFLPHPLESTGYKLVPLVIVPLKSLFAFSGGDTTLPCRSGRQF